MTVQSHNPSSGEVLDTDIAESSASDVAAACERAASAAAELAARPLAWRAQWLEAIAAALDADAENIIALADAETGLGVARLTGELKRSSFQFRFFAAVVRDGAFVEASIDNPTDSPMGPLPDLRRQLEPLGVVGVFGASNFPLAFSVPGGDTASALAAGCPVVIKAHPAHPRTSAATFAALVAGSAAATAPEGSVNLVFGLEAGVALVQDPRVSAVGFTGSYAAGRALFDRAQSRPVPIPFYGELGSVNPLVVTPAAADERGPAIGEGLAASMALGSGQFCTKPGLAFVPVGAAGDGLVEACAAAVSAGAGATMLTSAIRDTFESGVSRHDDVAGLSCRARSARAATAAGSFAVLYECDVATLRARHAVLDEEYFGALCVVVRYASMDELLDTLAGLEPALTFAVHVAEGDPEGAPLIRAGSERAGRVLVNGFPTGVGVSWSMHHGGPHPAATSSLHSSVGASGIRRWLRPVCYQAVPADWLPEALRDDNPLGIPQRVDGELRLPRG